MARLGDAFVLIRNGASIKQTKGAGGIPITRIETISNCEVDRNKLGYAGILDVQKYSDYILQDEDILMSHINSEKHLGKAAIYKKADNEQIIHGMNLLMLRPNPQVMYSKYALYYFETPFFHQQIVRITKKSVNQASFTVTALKDIEIPAPSLETQKEVAKTLDKLTHLISLRKQQLAKLDELVKARFVEMFGEDFDVASLNSVCTFIDYRGRTPEKSDTGVPLITAKNVRENSFSVEPREFIPAENYESVMTRGIPKVNDVLFTTEAPLGNVCRIPNIYQQFCVGQRIITMHPHCDVVTAEYLEQALREKRFQDKVWEKSSGSTVRGIRSKLLEWLTIPVPPYYLQCAFSDFVWKIDEQRLTIQQSLDKMEVMKKSLMQEYFG